MRRDRTIRNAAAGRCREGRRDCSTRDRPEPLSSCRPRAASSSAGATSPRRSCRRCRPTRPRARPWSIRSTSRFQVPAAAGGPPLVLVHGCCLTGQAWETTPGRASGLGRGPAARRLPGLHGRPGVARALGRPASRPLPTATGPLPTVFSAGREDAWTVFRIGPRFPEPPPRTRCFPVEAAGELWKSMVPDFFYALPDAEPDRAGAVRPGATARGCGSGRPFAVGALPVPSRRGGAGRHRGPGGAGARPPCPTPEATCRPCAICRC